MGIYNRDYMSDEADHYGRPRRASGPRSWSVVTWIIVINIAAFLLQVLIFDTGQIGKVSRSELFSGHVYLLLTYQFVHANPLHLLFNMLMLYFTGYHLKSHIGTKSFLGLYFGAGVFGALLQVLYSPAYVLGASASVLGVVFGFISLAPRQEISLLLFFIIPIRTALWKIGAFIVAIDLIGLIAQDVFGMASRGERVAYVAHLGGAFMGWFWISRVQPFLQQRNKEKDREGRWSQAFGTRKVVDAEIVDKKPKKSKTKDEAFVSKDIDAILDKISEQGMHSLTAKEKKLLEKHSEKLKQKIDDK